MAYEQRDNSGTAFVNDRKESEKHPDWSGSAMIDGKMYWVSMWDKTANSGKSMRTLSFKPKQTNPVPAPSRVNVPPQRSAPPKPEPQDEPEPPF